ncbi:PfkB family carbohydrate kinase [Desulfovibrio sp. JC010]|uniref:PfkB family carbohydrate kinase n=1 Tax=Desulfovibrio sp. JC010 TaxID=2593641 RepID=UPI0013D1E039|nr:PfkB family carbohydrate kinase [Desulfovibrio sp. JC010]NDV26776.1 carbohydrate kinase [Desulfovibrio sp. JC010]
MKQLFIAGLGEILFDVLADSEEIGGAPVNFAYHANKLGADGAAISTLGNDERGRRASSELMNRELCLSGVSIDREHETGYVEARLDEQGVATYFFPDDIAWDHLQLNDAAMGFATQVNAVCFGTLAQRSEISRKAIRTFLDAAPQALKVYDMNLRQNFYSKEIIAESLELADVLKLNDDEIAVVAPMFGLEGSERDMLITLHDEFDLKCSVLTRGSKGSLIIGENGEVEHPGIEVKKIADTIGAGDSFTASVAIGLLLGHSLSEISEHANRLAAHVCSCKGAMPAIPAEFKLIK